MYFVVGVLGSRLCRNHGNVLLRYTMETVDLCKFANETVFAILAHENPAQILPPISGAE